MQLLHAPAALGLYLAALILTAVGGLWRKGTLLPWIGGLCWVAGTLAALLAGVPLRVLLVVTLLLLGLSALRTGKERRL